MLNKKADIFYRIAIQIVFIRLLIGPFLHSLKLIHTGGDFGVIFLYLTLPLLAIFFSLSLLFGEKPKGESLDFLGYSLLLTIAWASIWTLFYLGSVVDIAGNFLRLVMSFCCYFTTKRYLNTETFLNLEKKIIKFGLIGVSLGLAVTYFTLIRGGAVYLGLSTDSALPSIAYSLVYGGWPGIIGGIFIVMGGKRGIMLAMMFAIILYNILFGSRKKILIATVFLFVLGTGMALFINTQKDIVAVVDKLPRPVQSRIQPFLTEGDNDIDIQNATQSRSTEVESVVKIWKKNNTMIFTGMGLGAWFTDVYGLIDNTIHISPVALSFQFGIPFAVLLLFAIFSRPFIAATHYKKKLDKQGMFWVVLSLAFLFTTFSVFEIFQNPLIWICLARISSKQMVKNTNLIS